MSTARVDGIEIAFDEVGSGGRVILLVHGHPFDRSMWQPQLESLARLGWRAVAPDLRGYGASSVVGEKTTLDVFARDLAGLLDHLRIDRVVLVGLSMGGQIVMEFCRLFPTRVMGIVLAATFPRADTAAGRQQRTAMAERLLTEGMAGYAEEALPKMLAGCSIDSLPEVASHVLTMMRNAHPAGAAAALRGRSERPDYSEFLKRLDRPALIVVGDEDAFTTREDADSMRAALKDSQLLWLRGAGHIPNLERPEAFNAALKEFLGQIPSSGQSREHGPVEDQTILVTGATSGAEFMASDIAHVG